MFIKLEEKIMLKLACIILLLMPLLALIMFLGYYVFDYVKEEPQKASLCFNIAIGSLVLTVILETVIVIFAIITMA